MKIGLYDVDSHNYPNLCLMKISAWHKAQGDSVEWLNYLEHYDIVYVSKTFGAEYSSIDNTVINADRIIYGGTGFAIDIKDGKEVYSREKNADLPPEIEHIYPDYALYPQFTKNRAYGFLTRGCPNNCDFCIVSKKEGRTSVKVADLSEFWRGQKHIEILDANLLACKDRLDLLQQIIDSRASINFMQGLDARFITQEIAEKLAQIRKIECIHFAFDYMKNENAIVRGLKAAHDALNLDIRKSSVYMLTNFNTTFEEDLHRIRVIQSLGYMPDVRIYRKETAPKITRYLQAWCNNRICYNTCDFWEWRPSRKSEGVMIKELYADLYRLYGNL